MKEPITDKESLIKRLSVNRSVIKSFGVKHLGLFGSFANGKVSADSDVDFMVEFDKDKKTYDNFMDLAFYLEELTGRKIELVTEKSLSKYIGPHILKQVEDVSL